MTTFPDTPSENEVFLIGKIVETIESIEELSEQIHELGERIQTISQYITVKEGI